MRKDTLKCWHEVQVGLILGLLVGIAGFMRAWTYNQGCATGDHRCYGVIVFLGQFRQVGLAAFARRSWALTPPDSGP